MCFRGLGESIRQSVYRSSSLVPKKEVGSGTNCEISRINVQ